MRRSSRSMPAFARSEGFGAPAKDLGVKPAGLPRAEILYVPR